MIVIFGAGLAAAIPSWLVGKYRVDLRGEPCTEDHYHDLLTTLRGERIQAPEIGAPSRRAWTASSRDREPGLPPTAPGDPIRILGVIVDEVRRIAVLDPEQRRPLALSGEGVEPFLGDLWEVDGELLQELHLGRLLRDAELEALGTQAALADRSGEGAETGEGHRASAARLAGDGPRRP